jgi:hypothetical protein
MSAPTSGLVALTMARTLVCRERSWVMCYEWFERRRAKEALEKGKEQAESLIRKIKAAAQPRPGPEPEKRPAVEKEKATV